ncbi:hypothetical protein BDW75DRAFT_210080 [Aspergillus navahoensis]
MFRCGSSMLSASELWPLSSSLSSASCLRDKRWSLALDSTEELAFFVIFLATPLVASISNLAILSLFRCVAPGAPFCFCWSRRNHEAGRTPLILF